MTIDFPRYLDAKYHLDLRSIHKATLDHLNAYMEKIGHRPQILELGGGIGSMCTYLVRDGSKLEINYTLLDAAKDNIAYIPKNLKTRSELNGYFFEDQGNQNFRITKGQSICHLHTMHTPTEEFLFSWIGNPGFDIVVASSYLDIVPVPETLRLLEKVTNQQVCLYLPFNYDGLTYFHPVIDRHLDDEIIALYDASMDNRRIGDFQTGGSFTGRKLLDWLPAAGYEIVSAGSSDWFLSPHQKNYYGDERYFLECILQFVEDSVSSLWKGKPDFLEKWLSLRRQQVAMGKLSFLAHQMDYLALR